MEMILMLVILVGGLFLMNSFARRSQKKRQDERERMISEDLAPGVWVQTFSGFYGRFVDTDGDVVILETPSGEETYWMKASIRGVGEPPFEALHDDHDFDEITQAADLGSSDIETDVVEMTENDGDATVDFDEFEARFRAEVEEKNAEAEAEESSDEDPDQTSGR